MKKVGSILNILAPMVVLGSLFAFVVYAIFLYQPDQARSCQKSGIAQQFDIAVHVVRQWVGREGQMYLTCNESQPGGSQP